MIPVFVLVKGRQPEIDELPALFGLMIQDIFGFHVAVDNTFLMDGFQCLGDFP